MSKTTKIIISVVAIALLAFAWWRYAVNPKNSVINSDTKINEPASLEKKTISPAVPSEVKPNETVPSTAQWKTYRNMTMGFEIEYPADWYVKEELGRVTFSNEEYFESNEESAIDFSHFEVSLDVMNGQSVKNWFQKNVEFSMKPESVESVTVGGHQAIRAEPSVSIDKRLNYYIPASSPYIVVIIIGQEQEKFIKTHERMLSTFKFLKGIN